MKKSNEKYTILYARLSQEDGRDGVSNSISNQQAILEKYASDIVLKIANLFLMMVFLVQLLTEKVGMRLWN